MTPTKGQIAATEKLDKYSNCCEILWNLSANSNPVIWSTEEMQIDHQPEKLGCKHI